MIEGYMSISVKVLQNCGPSTGVKITRRGMVKISFVNNLIIYLNLFPSVAFALCSVMRCLMTLANYFVLSDFSKSVVHRSILLLVHVVDSQLCGLVEK